MTAAEDVRDQARARVERGLRAAIDLLGLVAENEAATELTRDVLLAIRGLEMDVEEMATELAKLGAVPS